MDKERCVNKKLHPYWKTGIYGWLGEEVDDNDYVICPICEQILSMNYWDYSAEHNSDNKCPECGQELDYSEIYDFEDTLYFKQLLEMKDEKIEDLEAKLDEKTRVAQGYCELFDKKQHENYEQFCEIQQFIQQLADTDKLMQEYLNKCLSLEKQLAESEREVKKLRRRNTDAYLKYYHSHKEQISKKRKELYRAKKEKQKCQNQV